MITLLMNGVFFLLVFVESLKQKKYRYMGFSTLTLIYFLLAFLQSNYDLIDNSTLFGHLQRLILVVLAVSAAIGARKPFEKKVDVSVTVWAGIACLFRFVRTGIFYYYTEKMQISGADVMAINKVFNVLYMLADSAVKLALLLMLFKIAMYLGAPRKSDC